MQLVTPQDLKRFLDANGLSVTDIVADTRLHSNTIYRFMNRGRANSSTVQALSDWKARKEAERGAAGQVASG